MRKYITTLVVSMFIVSCADYKYPQSLKLTERNGARVDSSASFLLDSIAFGGVEHRFNWDEQRKQTIDLYYLWTSEPVLYNFYQGREIYRFVIEKEGRSPLLIIVNIENNKAWVVSKRLYEREQIAENCGIEVVWEFDHYMKDLSSQELDKFRTLLKQVKPFELTNSVVNEKIDGYTLIELHEKGKYWVVYRSLDDEDIKDLTDFVVRLTRFNCDMEALIQLAQ